MLTVISKHKSSDHGKFLQEGKKNKMGGTITKQAIEKVAKLPDGYNVGTRTKTDNFFYEVVRK